MLLALTSRSLFFIKGGAALFKNMVDATGIEPVTLAL